MLFVQVSSRKEDENIIIVDISDRTEYKADDMTVKELKSYDINQIDVITANEDKIYIYF